MNNDITQILTLPQLQSKLLPVKILFIIVSLFLAGIVIFVLRSTDFLKYLLGYRLTEFTKFKSFEKVAFAKKWDKTKVRLEKGAMKGWESEAKLAIIEADQLLDDALKRMGYVGDSLGERLKQIGPDLVPNIERVWEVHKIRNNIVHDPDYRLSFAKAQEALTEYGKTLEALRAL